ncbi:MAG: hypothetical protein JXB49_10770 [Bacteroidales bacterium]|nr:hypothetical protein [Bacteroidales bacterium]
MYKFIWDEDINILSGVGQHRVKRFQNVFLFFLVSYNSMYLRFTFNYDEVTTYVKFFAELVVGF